MATHERTPEGKPATKSYRMKPGSGEHSIGNVVYHAPATVNDPQVSVESEDDLPALFPDRFMTPEEAAAMDTQAKKARDRAAEDKKAKDEEKKAATKAGAGPGTHETHGGTTPHGSTTPHSKR
jgi:hypothetical protein